ncbi:MAG: SPOR domain-containing protein [Rickettsiella sp.]|nr:SPOR domain-containing protein [Rickettsiella sp.]
MVQLRSPGTITIIVLLALLVIFVPHFFKNVQTELKPLMIPNQPFLPSSDQINSVLNNTSLSFKNSFRFPIGLAQAWVLQISDFKENSAANVLVQTLRKKGFKSYTRHIMTTTGPMFRVFVGPEIKSEQIKALATQLNKTMQLKSTISAFDPLLL